MSVIPTAWRTIYPVLALQRQEIDVNRVFGAY
jgi:hypothetical protein